MSTLTTAPTPPVAPLAHRRVSQQEVRGWLPCSAPSKSKKFRLPMVGAVKVIAVAVGILVLSSPSAATAPPSSEQTVPHVVAPETSPASATPPFVARRSTDELFAEAAALEGISMRRAILAYTEAANAGHGPSMKRLYEIFKAEANLSNP